MNALIVLAHPEPQSFNGHLARVARDTLLAAGNQVELSDLYAEGFDPCEGPRHFAGRRNPARFDAQTEQRFSHETAAVPADVAREITRLLRADLLILQFPLWWFGVPAILKGWMDRVFTYGGMYSSTRKYDRGACRGKTALLSVTTGAPGTACAFNGVEGDTRLMLWPAIYSLRYLGFSVLSPFLFHGVRGGLSGLPAQAADASLNDTERRYAALLGNWQKEPQIAFNADTDFDANLQLRPGAPVHSPFIAHRPGLPPE